MLSMRREGESHDRGMTKAIKAEIFKFTGKKRELVQEVAAVLMEIVLAVESRKDQLFPKS